MQADRGFGYGLYQNTEPILNSLQSLAAVNKRIYDLCRPQLWKVDSVLVRMERASEGM